METKFIGYTRVGCYTLDLYCAVVGCTSIFNVPGLQYQYTGRTESECLRKAKAGGWLLRGNGKDFCPKCAPLYRGKRLKTK